MGKLVLIHCAVLFAPPLPLPNLGFDPRVTRIGKLLLIHCAVLFAPLPPSTTLPHSYFNFYDSNKSWCSAFMKFLSLGKFFALALFSKKRLCLSLSLSSSSFSLLKCIFNDRNVWLYSTCHSLANISLKCLPLYIYILAQHSIYVCLRICQCRYISILHSFILTIFGLAKVYIGVF